jgi:hypothetical protein
MTERWQAELTKLRRAQLPAEVWDRVGEGPRLEPLGPPPRSRLAAGVIALAVFALGAILVWRLVPTGEPTVRSLAGPEVLEVPASGVAPAFLSDGRPVFVVHHADGSISVIDGFSSHRPFGLLDIVGWCPSTSEFVELAHEARFDEFGNWVSAGPAPSGLATFDFDVVERDASGNPVAIRVGTMRNPSPGGSAHETDPSTYPAFCPAEDPDAATPGTQAVVSGNTGQAGRVLTHSISLDDVWSTPAALVAAAPGGWAAVDGQLFVAPDGFVQLCADVVEDRCVDGAIVRGLDGIRLKLDVIDRYPDFYAVHPYTWLARVQDGVLVDLAGIKDQVRAEGA